MAYQLVTRADLEGITSTLTTLIKHMENLAKSGEQSQQQLNHQRERGEQVIVLRGGNNHHDVIAGNLSFEEEEPYNEDVIDNENQYNRDYRVKTNIPLFYGTMGMNEFLDWQIDVARFFS